MAHRVISTPRNNPNGYTGMFALAAIPPLWFRVMDSKALAWAGGDITKLNLGERAPIR